MIQFGVFPHAPSELDSLLKFFVPFYPHIHNSYDVEKQTYNSGPACMVRMGCVCILLLSILPVARYMERSIRLLII